MGIKVNNRDVEYVEGETVSGLLKRMNYIYRMLVVKIDGEVIPKIKYGDTPIPDGGAVEIIHIESGG